MSSCTAPPTLTPRSKYFAASAGLVVGLGVWWALAQLPSLPVFDAAPLLFALVCGVLAGLTSCGVLAGVAVLTVTSSTSSPKAAAWATLRFHGARVLAFAATGAVLGASGALIPVSVFDVVRYALAAAVVVLLASMAGLIPKLPASRITVPSLPEVAGAVTVLAPCGLTLAVFLLAASTASPLLGAAVCAVFAVACIPGLSLYAAVPSLVRSPSGRVSMLVAAGVLAVASLLAPTLTPVSTATAVASATDGQVRIPIQILPDRYVPSTVSVPAGSRVWVDFDEPTVWSCMATPTLPDGRVANTLSGQLSYDLGVLNAGSYTIACPSGHGSVVITAS